MDRFFIAWLLCFACTILVFEFTCIIAPFLKRYYYFIARNVFALIIAHWLFLLSQGSIFKKRVNSNKKAIFITGCDSGFGFQLARQLDSKGFHVFAGCLFPMSGGAAELKSSCSSRFCTVHIDVTQDDSVQTAKEFVTSNLGDCELWAVVNNAGIWKGFALEFTEVSDFIDTLQVNTLGQVRVAKAFLPLLRRSRGRIVNVNSLAGRIAVPSMTPYAMSKFAAVAFTECLRRELEASDIKVISIEPSFFKTPLCDGENVKKQLERIKSSAEENFKSSNGKKYFKRMKLMASFLDTISSSNTHYVTDTIEAAVSMQHPCPIYKPCGSTTAWIMVNCFENFPVLFSDTLFSLFNVAAPVLVPLCSAFR